MSKVLHCANLDSCLLNCRRFLRDAQVGFMCRFTVFDGRLVSAVNDEALCMADFVADIQRRISCVYL